MNLNRLIMPQTLRLLAVLAGVALAVLTLPLPVSASPTTRTITLFAKQFEFSPARLEVNEGDHVIITVQADDVVHGFYLDGYGLVTRIEPGISQRIEFVADRTGKFRYRCSVTCGPMHPFMIGELIVGPNLLFWRVLSLTVIVATGTLLLLRTSERPPLERMKG